MGGGHVIKKIANQSIVLYTHTYPTYHIRYIVYHKNQHGHTKMENDDGQLMTRYVNTCDFLLYQLEK